MSCILIVEDEMRIAAFIEKGLTKNGFQTAIASNGEEALQMLAESTFELLVLDIQLPIKNGWMILSELRAQEKVIPIIIITACFDAAEKINKLPQQNLDYLIKPFRFIDLLMQIKKMLGLYSDNEKN
jgi:DNA-binding response OmpR family regulator